MNQRSTRHRKFKTTFTIINKRKMRKLHVNKKSNVQLKSIFCRNGKISIDKARELN